VGILDELKLEKRVATCKVRTVANNLDADDSKKFLEAAENDEWPINTLSKSLGQLGVQISGVPLAAHRNKGCSCYRA
jgi:hypothetical protein